MRFLGWMVVLLAGLATAQTPNERVFRGHILVEPQELPIRMYLRVSGQRATGYYVYEGREQPLRLEGTFGPSGLKLKEFEGSKQTGAFDGGYTEAGLEGDWYRPDGKVGGRFSLAEQDHRFGATQLSTVRLADRGANIAVLYPRFVGQGAGWERINAQTAQAAQRSLKLYREDYQTAVRENNLSQFRYFDLDYTLTLGTERLVSFTLSGSACGPGGCAYPGSWIEGHTFDPQTGSRVPLSALFKPGSRYLERLVTLGRQKVRGQLEANGVPPADLPGILERLGLEGLQWALGPKGIWLYFSVPHVLGDYQGALLEYTELRDLLAASGPIRAVVR
ncbi:MAG: RsiV family protein [Meiothermus sp.]|nr:RsiV family protein [Meiothermus sp.]